MEVALAGLAQPPLVALPELVQDPQEELAAPPIGAPRGALLEGAASGGRRLEVVDGRAQQLRQSRELPPGQFPDRLPLGHRLKAHTGRLELLPQPLAQHAAAPLPAVALDQVRAVLLVERALPRHALCVASPPGRRPVRLVEREVLDVEVVVREVEVRPVLSIRRGGSVHLVGRLVCEPHTVEREEVGDQQLLVATD